MYIKEIEFENFKSFEGYNKITFKKGFNCITGANGSGKSNIIDGIKFALGFLNILHPNKEGFEPISNNYNKDEASVKIAFLDEKDNSEFSIKRIVKQCLGSLWNTDCAPKEILYDDNIFYINDKSVTKLEYTLFLEKLNIIQNHISMSATYKFSPYNLLILDQDNIPHIAEEDIKHFHAHIIKENRVQDMEKYSELLKTINSDFSKIYKLLSNKKCEMFIENKSNYITDDITMACNSKTSDELTNGEKFLYVLAFIFTIQKHLDFPCYIFDCIDYGLDNYTTKQLANCIKEITKDKQYIVVSLQKTMLENADNVITLNKKGLNYD